MPCLVEAFEDPAEVTWRQQGRRTAAEEHGVHLGRLDGSFGELHLGEHLVDVLVAADSLVRGVRVEVAVPAAAGAEGYVDVHPEAEPADGRQGRAWQRTVGRRRFTVGELAR